MNYEETVNYLFTSAPLFQNIGAGAYKEGLQNTKTLDNHFGNPHTKYKTIHIAGTNGKGSCAHTIAAILQSAGYKTGLYTSPHLVDFRERIRVDGKMISKQEVIDFVEKERFFFEPLHPSFFELTTALAFEYFAKQKVDVAVVEVGLGGRLDCTNIIKPEVSVITNISFDHTQFLGSTLAQIAKEKAGIIKPGITAVIGETVEETKDVFEKTAKAVGAPIVFAEDKPVVKSFTHCANGIMLDTNMFAQPLHYELGGDYQQKNANTILCTVKELRKKGFNITDEAIRDGFEHVGELTGLHGRWEVFSEKPLVILDTGHNPGGLAYNMQQLKGMKAGKIRIVIGMVSDKDIDTALGLMPKEAEYHFTKASVKRAMNEVALHSMAAKHGLNGNHYPNVAEAYKAALKDCSHNDIIYIGGSNFIVGDFLAYRSLEEQK